MRAQALFAAALAAWTGPALADFQSCVANLRSSVVAAGVSPAVAAKALDLTAPNDKVVRLSKVQPEFKMPIWDYIGFLVDEQRVDDGKALMRKHAAALKAAEERFGVSRYVIAGVWGVETNFGQDTGDNYLPHALATLICTGNPRANFWRSELIAALKLVHQGDLQLNELYGSWAGAFGQTQFIPTTYQRLAVDFDGDGRRDLVKSTADALGSTANYLRKAGWRPGQPYLVEVKVPSGYSGPTGRKNRVALATYANHGVTRADGRPLSGNGAAGLLLPAGRNGPGFLVFPNFDAIYAYNQAESYALAISYLAQRLAGGPELVTAWPTDDPGLNRLQRLDLQKLLIARGYNIGDADGKIGQASRAAIAAAEQSVGMPGTGRAGTKIYRALGGRQ
ncbi:lytic murein transglycosylase [Chelatococcus reniformis]|uniref:Transglycosylase n=1 Tax=Chelatococcus reniformis TaxID=1494448 RepID=A0A916U8D0_9HYPH|nr:lytic murein transglycosylase [Chelatococcus reniformis]GGC63238.1 transglycosylase [Chelatococcus reniformis]